MWQLPQMAAQPERRRIFIQKTRSAKLGRIPGGQLGLGRECTLHNRVKIYSTVGMVGDQRPIRLLAVPAALQFTTKYDWSNVGIRCHQILKDALWRISDLTRLPSVYSEDGQRFAQMVLAPLPPIQDLSAFQDQLFKQYLKHLACSGTSGLS
jgi:hypothetical protein